MIRTIVSRAIEGVKINSIRWNMWDIREFRIKGMKTQKKNAQRAVVMAGASRIGKFVNSNLLREYDVDPCWDVHSIFYDFSQHVSGFARSTAVCSATVRRDLLLELFNPYHIISSVIAGRCLIFCVLRDEHPSIDRHVCPFFLLSCCWRRLLYRYYTSTDWRR